MDLRIVTADELIDPEREARRTARRAARHTDVMRQILGIFVDRPGAIPLAEIQAAFPERPREALREAVDDLDHDDLIQVQDGSVIIAYPFSARPTAFAVQWAGGDERYACCAIDALGMAPMLGRRVHVRSQCHHCKHPLELPVDVDGLGAEAEGLMVWIGQRTEEHRRIADSL